MQLSPVMVAEIAASMERTLHNGYTKLKECESLVGKCVHACQIIPQGLAFVPPLHKALRSVKTGLQPTVQILHESPQWHALSKLWTIIKFLGNAPVYCARLGIQCHLEDRDVFDKCDLSGKQHPKYDIFHKKIQKSGRRIDAVSNHRPSRTNSKYEVLVQWASGEASWEDMGSIFNDDPVSIST
ncbi:expressed unknown protein [Seminavis robusta]|uniref:Chromo domain-containing protein n=1 Tax=Seminavis robusta TaxID=568900 RepID=A0A9N8D774_9STRA|nr:expressed unknown protein [Seminavis robusta]|eukprot:Sro5_g004060.1 n/a (184) ;mRNA; r:40156-40707